MDSNQVPIAMDGRYIPTDIMLNILVRLPASSLQRLKYVSKGWLQIISDPDLAEAHLSYQSREKFGRSMIIGMKQYVLLVEGTASSKQNLPRHMKLPGAHGDTWVYGSCKGLVLFQCSSLGGKVVSLHVANPITGDRLSLPSFYGCSGSILSASIGCGRGREIKVVVVGRRGKKILSTQLICGVLTLGSRAWRKVHIPIQGNLLEPYTEPIYAGGALHWIYNTGVLSLNLCQVKFNQTEVTFCSYSQLRYYSDYLEWDGCYAVIFTRPQLSKPFYRIWVMKESGWTKLPDIDAAFFRHLGHPSGEDGSPGIGRPYMSTTMRNGEVIIFWQVVKDKWQLFAYDLCSGAITNFSQFDCKYFSLYRGQGHVNVMVHMNSMMSCSTYAFSERNGICQIVAIILTLLLDLATTILLYFRCIWRYLV